jgi:hypothetical protein
MKYEIRVKGGAVSVADVVDDLVSGVDSVLTIEEKVNTLGGSIENNGFGKMIGRVYVESERVISSRVVNELKNQFPGIEFELEEVDK